MDRTGIDALDMVRDRRSYIARLRLALDEEDNELQITERALQRLQSEKLAANPETTK